MCVFILHNNGSCFTRKNVSVPALDGPYLEWWDCVCLVADGARDTKLEIQLWYKHTCSYMHWETPDCEGCCLSGSAGAGDVSLRTCPGSTLIGEGKRGTGVMLVRMLTVGFWNICSAFFTLALGENIPCHQINPDILLYSEGRILSVGHQ